MFPEKAYPKMQPAYVDQVEGEKFRVTSSIMVKDEIWGPQFNIKGHVLNFIITRRVIIMKVRRLCCPQLVADY